MNFLGFFPANEMILCNNDPLKLILNRNDWNAVAEEVGC